MIWYVISSSCHSFRLRLSVFFFSPSIRAQNRPTFIRLVTLDSLTSSSPLLSSLLRFSSLLPFPFLSFLYFPLCVSLSDTAVVVVILAVSFHRDYAHPAPTATLALAKLFCLIDLRHAALSFFLRSLSRVDRSTDFALFSLSLSLSLSSFLPKFWSFSGYRS